MCRAVPDRVNRVEGDQAWLDGQSAPVSLLGVDGVRPGDYLLHHAGLALAVVDPAEAQAIAEALAELDALFESDAEAGRYAPAGPVGPSEMAPGGRS